MASRHWVGGDGTWDLLDTTHWSSSTGGPNGASSPTDLDIAVFDGPSGASVVTLGEDVSVGGISCSAFAGTFAFGAYKISLSSYGNVLLGGTGYAATGSKNVELTYSGAEARSCFTGNASEANALNIKVLAGTGTVNVPTNGAKVGSLDFTGFSGSWISSGAQGVFGDLTLSPTMTDAATGLLTISKTGGTQAITTNGVALNRSVTLSGTSTKVFADNFSTISSGVLSLTQGTINSADKNVSVGSVAASGTGVRGIQFGSGTWTVAGSGSAWDCATATNMTISYSAGSAINLTSASAKTFAGGGASWPTLNQGGAGALTITGSNTFADITASSLPSTISFTGSTTQTVSAFSAKGTVGNLLTLNAVSGSWAIVKTGGSVRSNYLSVSNSAASGGQWYAGNASTDGGGNTGWRFTNDGGILVLLKAMRRI